jgi:hypothetical protein
MSSAELKKALSKIDWKANVDLLINNTSELSAIHECYMRLALWSKELESADKDNPALSFIREMQVAGYHAGTLISLALYKPAASSMRIILETALFYSYFRTHLCELATLVRNDQYYMQKSDIIAYHKLHTPNFSELNLITRLDKWYKDISSVIHGQKPGAWLRQIELSDVRHIDDLKETAIENFRECTGIVNDFFLCTIDRELWHGFSHSSKKELLKGIKGETKAILGLDMA